MNFLGTTVKFDQYITLVTLLSKKEIDKCLLTLDSGGSDIGQHQVTMCNLQNGCVVTNDLRLIINTRTQRLHTSVNSEIFSTSQ